MNSFRKLINSLFRLPCAFLCVLLITPNAAAEDKVIQLSIGEEHTLTLDSYARSVDLTEKDIISVRKGATKKILYLKAARPGSVKLNIDLGNSNLQTFVINVSEDPAFLSRELSSISGLTIKPNGGVIQIEGTITSRGDLNKLKYLKSRYPNRIDDRTLVEITSSNAYTKTINRLLERENIPNIQAHAYGKLLLLEGSAKDKNQADLAVQIAQSIFPGIDVKLSEDTNGGPSIAIDVLFVEVSREKNTDIGFKNQFAMTPTMPNEGVARATISGDSGLKKVGNAAINWQVGGLATFLQMIQHKAFSRVLANPKLVTRSHSNAKFHSGRTTFLEGQMITSQTPVAAPGGANGQAGFVQTSYTPVDSGIELDILPKMDAVGNIDAKVSTSVSTFADVDEGGNPSKITSEVASNVTIPSGQTILISGLVHQSESKNVERVPLLGDIPVVGEIFKFRSFTKLDREILVLVTMRQIEATGSEENSEAMGIWEKAEDDVEFSFFD